MEHIHDRWTCATYALLADRHGLPRLAAFYRQCDAGSVPATIPNRLSKPRLMTFASDLQAHGIRVRDCTAVLDRYEHVGDVDVDNAYATLDCPWQYESRYGGHPALPSLAHVVCLAAVDECLPAASWRVRRLIDACELDTLFTIADGMNDVLDHALSGYDHLSGREIVVAERCAPFIPTTVPDLEGPWAIGVAYRDVLLGLSTLIDHSTGAGTQILAHWKATRQWLIAHHVTNVAYFTARGFVPIPRGNHQPLPGETRCQQHLCWQIDPVRAAVRIDQLGLSWYDNGAAADDNGSDSSMVASAPRDSWQGDAPRHPTEVRLILTAEEYAYVAAFQRSMQQHNDMRGRYGSGTPVTLDDAVAAIIAGAQAYHFDIEDVCPYGVGGDDDDHE